MRYFRHVHFTNFIAKMAANARAHEHSVFGASPARTYMYYNASATGTSEENFETFREIFVSKTMVLHDKFVTNRAITSTLNVFSFDKLDISSRPWPLRVVHRFKTRFHMTLRQ